jgi:hypothetical protein
MTIPPSFDMAMRYVTLAVWHESSQEGSGYYEVTLNCGHAMRCSHRFLSHSMLCVTCCRESPEGGSGR